MSNEVYWIYVVRVNEGASEQFKDLVEDLVVVSGKVSGTISYHRTWATTLAFQGIKFLP